MTNALLNLGSGGNLANKYNFYNLFSDLFSTLCVPDMVLYDKHAVSHPITHKE